ncbi:hypothetical protein GNY06_07005 [Elizabethkingia argentiflava]|uniref:Holin-X, holin superfamily III n=1 Tax=Elizabethkingia argenteiflava TaxID=2681556 RepID=A0A845PSC9_9FLAO|nr:phage holin family protein [Elizabethkingia argenteiflava]NAW51132.1 hypothetical protein [Elizabethkingia argenteiflava]
MFSIISDYLKKKMDLFKLEVVEKTLTSAGAITFSILLLAMLTFFIGLLSVGISLWLGDILQNISYGFLSVSGFYLFIIILMIIFKKKLKKEFTNLILKYFNN